MKDSSSYAGGQFEITRWTMVLEAKGPDSAKSEKALAELCQKYWGPIYAFIRRQGWAEADAEDLTQSFFAQFLKL